MLSGVETGYEGKYDFPPRTAPPETTYMLATVPRTGSTFLSHLLWRTGCMGAPLEYLNFDSNGPYFFASKSPSGQQRLWQSALRRRTSPNGVFGVKCFPGQLHLLEQHNPPLLREVMSLVLGERRSPKVIHLARRDRVAHAVSYARAALSGVWRAEQESDQSSAIDYSERAIARMEAAIDQQSEAWEQMFRELEVEPLRLWYEDVLASPGEAIERVSGYLGVDAKSAAPVAVPQIRKQRQDDSADWISRYRRSREV